MGCTDLLVSSSSSPSPSCEHFTLMVNGSTQLQRVEVGEPFKVKICGIDPDDDVKVADMGSLTDPFGKDTLYDGRSDQNGEVEIEVSYDKPVKLRLQAGNDCLGGVCLHMSNQVEVYVGSPETDNSFRNYLLMFGAGAGLILILDTIRRR